MIKIDLIDICIKAAAADNHEDVREFGRTLRFSDGLNLVVGDNTSGKTTIVRTLFYCLGMEELIDGKIDDRSLDKSVKDSFRCNVSDKGDIEWIVKSSYVILQLSNDKGKYLTIKRVIKEDNAKHNVIAVWENSYDKMLSEARREYYIHSSDDHNIDYGTGFYALLSRFGDIPIIDVPSRNSDKMTKLYLQTLFALTYIEQTRGWSDFFATIRSFNITSPKQRIIEYAMNYDMDTDLSVSNSLKQKKKAIEVEWQKHVRDLTRYLSYNKMFVDQLLDDINKQLISVDDLRIGVRDVAEDLVSYRAVLITRVNELELKAKSAIKDSTDDGYKKALSTYQEHKRAYEQFCFTIADETRKLNDIKRQVGIINSEIKRYHGLNKVNNIVSNMDISQCPTCHQPLPVDNDSFIVNKEQIEYSLRALDMQRKFLKPMIDKLEQSIGNQEMNKLYLENQLSEELAKLKAIADEANVNLNPLTTAEQYDLVDGKSKLALLNSIEEHIKEEKALLKRLKNDYRKVVDDIKKQTKGEKTESPIDNQEIVFKKYLTLFGYTSNQVGPHVGFSEQKNMYQYLPVVIKGEYEEEIRSDSSASDFIRSIWAYYLTLLSVGENHPGFLVMDEPCQHSMKEFSLKRLFEACADIQDKQTILFCSSQPHTAEMEAGQVSSQNKNVIETIVSSMKKAQLNYLIVDPKSIVLKDNHTVPSDRG